MKKLMWIVLLTLIWMSWMWLGYDVPRYQGLTIITYDNISWFEFLIPKNVIQYLACLIGLISITYILFPKKIKSKINELDNFALAQLLNQKSRDNYNRIFKDRKKRFIHPQ